MFRTLRHRGLTGTAVCAATSALVATLSALTSTSAAAAPMSTGPSTTTQTITAHPVAYAARPTFEPLVRSTDAGTGFAPATGAWDAYDHSSHDGTTFVAWRERGTAGAYTIVKVGLHGDKATVGTIPATADERIVVAAASHDTVFYALRHITTAGTPAALSDTSVTVGSLTQGGTATATTFPSTDPGYGAAFVYAAANGPHAVVVQHLVASKDTGAASTRTYLFDGTTWTRDRTAPGTALNQAPQIDLAVSDAGDLAQTWGADAVGGNILAGDRTYYAAVRPAGASTWGPAHQVVTRSATTPGGLPRATAPALTWNPQNETLDVIWAQDAGTPGSANNGLRSLTYTAGVWTGPVPLPAIDVAGTPADVRVPTRGTRLSATDITWTHPSTSETLTGLLVVLDGDIFIRPTSQPTFRQWAVGDSIDSSGIGTAQGGTIFDGGDGTMTGSELPTVSPILPDVYPPAVNATTQLQGDAVNVTLTGTSPTWATDQTGAPAPAGCTLRYGAEHQPLTAAPDQAVAATSSECRWETTTAPADGTYELTGTFTDLAGNTTTTVTTWVIDRIPDPVIPDPAGEPAPVTPAPVTPTLTGGGTSSVLAANTTTATWSYATTAGPGATWSYATTTYTPRGTVATATTYTGSSSTLRTTIPDGYTTCVSATVTSTAGLSASTPATCRTARLDTANRILGKRGRITTKAQASAHGHSLSLLRGAAGSKKAGKVTFAVAAGATIRFSSTGAGKVKITIPGHRAVTLSGKAAATATFRATRLGTVQIVHVGGSRKARNAPFTLDSATVTYH